MFYSESELKCWSNEQLVFKEISHRRSIASYVASLTLTSVTTVVSAGVLMPLTIPIGAFKAYKVNSHKSKLGMVRAELARRHLSPAEKQKRDILVPLAIAFTVYAITLGLADMIDIVPLDVQGPFNSGVEAVAGVEQGTGGMDKVGDTYQAFVIAEAIVPLSNAVIKPTLLPQPGADKEHY
ncbi:unnamed protein product [Rhizoctonia solani]|uniref:Uncharacterized protein n=1 Tax=Rhizoctonia solani TaxID=456999 RepID=A0A8H2WGA5_9AGAM|nr:unnamed protein product [Rhizoctonia solani]